MNRAIGGLITRMVLATCVLLLIVGSAFVAMLISIGDQRETARMSLKAQDVFVAAQQIQQDVTNMQAAQHEFIITGNPAFLVPWQAARDRLPTATAQLQETASDAAQHSQAQRIAQMADSYVNTYSVPTVNAAMRGDSSARSDASLIQGNRRVSELVGALDRFRADERSIIIARERHDDAMTDREVVAVVVGLVGSVIVIGLVGGYQTWLMVQPIRRAAGMADRLAGGDLATRMPETGKAEIGQLERSFNVMASTLEHSHDELAQLVDTQSALRRVATLVARGVPQAKVLEAVIEELGRLIGTEVARIIRFEPDGSGTIVAAWGGDDSLSLPAGSQVSMEGRSVTALVMRTGKSARMDNFDEATGPLIAHLRAAGIRAAVGAPIYVEGRLWGCATAATAGAAPPAPDAEARLAEYTDLIGTAIANAQARDDLVKSRARFVLATDQARQQIERDLHDGVQQRLVSLGLEVRLAEASVPPEMAQLREQLSAVVTGLTGTVEDVRELSRGVHPAILTEGGLRPALRALARRSGVTVDLDLHLDDRLPEPVEVAAYYVVAEALTNAAKHAHATVIWVNIVVRGDFLHLSVRDDGVGGAVLNGGSGLIGLTDRVEALGGTLTLCSPVGKGTLLQVILPLERAWPAGPRCRRSGTTGDRPVDDAVDALDLAARTRRVS
ncbi:CHASE3 domain-containing protein [Dactylosporangium sp. NPDC049525]|uniref:CHASE3 domain-containing protein n=1 Tax=Dactylosporangium sp. NPDC049525 TaxID=3154730 RepID=UPI003421B0B2